MEGKNGSWLAFDSIKVENREFFLMEHETYGKEAAWAVVDQTGKLAVDNVRNGFDGEVKRKLEEYLHPIPTEGEKQESPEQQEKAEKPQPADWQKYMENGEYLRSAEITEEQNYNLIDGRKNN
ncbi:MAG: DUF4316 domain-containing protein, partial [Acetatifactor muris]|nr:DUF4316 domain-containing protein [Acetatifactor muris]